MAFSKFTNPRPSDTVPKAGLGAELGAELGAGLGDHLESGAGSRPDAGREPSVGRPWGADYAWVRPVGERWVEPYQVRYPSNLDDGPEHGMPLGGFGAGCIGRSPGGDFNLWHIDGGEHRFGAIPACQFAIFEQGSAREGRAIALGTTPGDGLEAWQYDSLAGATYHALYPRAWTTYAQPFQAKLSCEQFSPILAHNYRETSYPVAVLVWTLHNPTPDPLTLSVMLSWQNLCGWFRNTQPSEAIAMRDDGSPVYDYVSAWGESAGNWNRVVREPDSIAIVLDQSRDTTATPQEGDGQWCIAARIPAGAEAFVQGRWDPTGEGHELWDCFAQDGSLSNREDETPAAQDEQIAGAIAIRVTLQAGQTLDLPFVLSWDCPVTEFAKGVSYRRRYTDFFGTDGRNALAIAQTALTQYPTWQTQIEAWQRPILDRTDIPDGLKLGLCNELYYLTQGGSLWSAASAVDPVGQYGVLECIDYRWYESLDVRLYGSFGLLELWPELEKAVMRAFARSIPAADTRERVIGYYLTIGEGQVLAQRKCAGATPHDLGAPNEHPWEKTNYTAYQDCNLWKDLASDFVLQVYRDYQFTGATDLAFLQECWPAVVEALHYLKQFDRDGDGIPENAGAPDQTFDDWRMRGVSAYCGGLWLAALEAAIAIGQILDAEGLDPTATSAHRTPSRTVAASIATFQTWLEQGKPQYQAKLWNGQYYRLDSESGSAVVLADQLCGQFYATLLNLDPIVPPDCALSALKTVYDACFVQFNAYLAQGGASGSDGRIAEALDKPKRRSPLPLGAANGVLPNGAPENANSTHPLEVWTGINFGLAAFLVQSGLRTEGMAIAAAIVQQIYDPAIASGLQFRTPEAITANATFRACHYLRAMAIWAIYRVI